MTRATMIPCLACCSVSLLGLTEARAQAKAEPGPEVSIRSTTALPGPAATTQGDPSASLAEVSIAERKTESSVENKSAFAESLEKERDFFRAITIWKELRFFSNESAAQRRYSLSIARDYWQSERFLSCVAAASQALREPSASAHDETLLKDHFDAHLQSANCYLELKIPSQAIMHLEQSMQLARSPTLARDAQRRGQAAVSYALAHNEAGNALAAQNYQSAALQLGDPRAKQLGVVLAQRVDVPSRSPVAAAVLGAVVPGLGHAYAGHWFDAAQALFFVGAFATASIAAYSWEHNSGRPLILTSVLFSLTGFFHIANIVGAERAARFFNERAESDYRDRARALLRE
jgi:tetratricopeptide (TPR) repeat protein